MTTLVTPHGGSLVNQIVLSSEAAEILRLEYRALQVLCPTAQLTPDGDDESRQSSQASQHPVHESNGGIG